MVDTAGKELLAMMVTQARQARRLAVVLLSGILMVVVLPFLFEEWHEPATWTEGILQLLVLLLPAVSLLALVILTRLVVKGARLSAEKERQYHVRAFLLGPIGCAWVIFELTKRVPDER